MNKKKKILKIVIASLFILIGTAACQQASVISQPLAPTLAIVLPTSTPELPTPEPPTIQPTTEPTSTQTTLGTCGETGVMTILYIAVIQPMGHGLLGQT